MRHRRIALYAGSSLVMVIAAVWFIYRDAIESFLSIDGCLDRGGAWNYEVDECRFVDV